MFFYYFFDNNDKLSIGKIKLAYKHTAKYFLKLFYLHNDNKEIGKHKVHGTFEKAREKGRPEGQNKTLAYMMGEAEM